LKTMRPVFENNGGIRFKIGETVDFFGGDQAVAAPIFEDFTKFLFFGAKHGEKKTRTLILGTNSAYFMDSNKKQGKISFSRLDQTVPCWIVSYPTRAIDPVVTIPKDMHWEDNRSTYHLVTLENLNIATRSLVRGGENVPQWWFPLGASAITGVLENEAKRLGIYTREDLGVEVGAVELGPVKPEPEHHEPEPEHGGEPGPEHHELDKPGEPEHAGEPGPGPEHKAEHVPGHPVEPVPGHPVGPVLHPIQPEHQIDAQKASEASFVQRFLVSIVIPVCLFAISMGLGRLEQERSRIQDAAEDTDGV